MANINNRVKNEIQEPFSTGENFADLFNELAGNHKKEGTVVIGEIVRIDNDFYVVDVGIKNEGYIPKKEFAYDEKKTKLNIGDKVEVFLEKIESRIGKTVLSREKAVKEEYWKEIEKLHTDNQTVNGTIFGKVKGGFTVDLNGIVAFLPGSQVDIRPIKDITPLMGMEQPFMILKIDREQGNIVVSRRAILEESRVEDRNKLLAGIVEGQIMDGVVKNITDYGAFIDLGSVDGLLHVTDISWGRISHPSEVLTLGQTVKVQVIRYHADTKRISLGMKQLERNPWQDIEKRFPTGSKHSGKITNITDYGAFIELEPGIEGLVHVSEISWVKSNSHPRKLLTPNQEVNYIVLDIDSSKHRISLGMKQCIDNPWQNFAAKNPINSIVEGEIKNVVDFGLFVGFDGDIDGLVYITDLCWDEKDHLEKLKSYKKGDPIKVMVLTVDPEKERISLGVKQLEGEDPKAEAYKSHKKGDIVTCIVTEVSEDSIEVEFGDNISASIKKSDLSNDRTEQRPARFAVGDRVDAKITTMDKSGRKFGLSIKALEAEEQKKAIAEYGSTDSGASLGDILGAALKKNEG